MKTFLLGVVVCVVCAAGARAQVRGASISAEPYVFSIPDHPESTSAGTMGAVRDLIGHSGSASAHGELPLWEVMPEKRVTPLGDSAREARKEHATAKKAVVLWTNF